MAGNKTRPMRAVLMAGATCNALAALMLAFPESIGAIASLPSSGPLLYRWVLVLFVALFGVAYAWLALQPCIHRPLVALGASAKTGVFIVAVTCWRLGDVPLPVLIPAVGDLVFAALFAWWLMATRAQSDAAVGAGAGPSTAG